MSACFPFPSPTLIFLQSDACYRYDAIYHNECVRFICSLQPIFEYCFKSKFHRVYIHGIKSLDFSWTFEPLQWSGVPIGLYGAVSAV